MEMKRGVAGAPGLTKQKKKMAKRKNRQGMAAKRGVEGAGPSANVGDRM